MQNKINVFVYGSLMKGYWNHDFLKDQRYIGKGILKGYEMYRVASFPGIVESGQEEDVIIGEVYEIDKNTLKNLDRLEGEGHMYKRVLERIILKENETNEKLEAFAYKWLGSVRGAEKVDIENMPWQPKRRFST